MSQRVPEAMVNQLINEAQRQGFRTKETPNRHIMFFSPNGGPIITFHRHAKTWKIQMEKLKAAGFNQIAEAVQEAIHHPIKTEIPVDLPKPRSPRRGELNEF